MWLWFVRVNVGERPRDPDPAGTFARHAWAVFWFCVIPLLLGGLLDIIGVI